MHKGRGDLHVLHTTPQTRLYSLRIPPENPHNHRPAQTRKNRPCIPLHLLPHLPPQADASLAPLLYRQLRQCKYHSSEYIYDDLLVDAALYAAAEDEIAAYETSEEGVERFFFAGGRGAVEEYYG